MLTQLVTNLQGDGDEPIQQALTAIRTHLGMEVGYVSEFAEGRSVFRHVDAPGLEAMIKVGDSQSLDDVYCRHILAGRLPQLITDTADYPIAQELPITAAVPIGAHVSVPIRLNDGSVHGMFCCLSPRTNRTLNERDLGVMHVFADLVAHQINRQVEVKKLSQVRRARLRDVIDTGAFSMVFQPIFNFESDRIVGYESLCRFTNLAYPSPDLWFNEAAAEGFSLELELCVVGRALAALPEIASEAYLSLNVSPETATSEELRRLLLHRTAERLVLEITEHAQVSDYAVLRKALAPLRKAGVRLAVDDAGAGFASLQHIVQLQPDIIKLDIGLTRGVDVDSSRRALTAALTYFAAETGSAIIAEGIETAAELRVLKALGVRNGQGYFLGRPAALSVATHSLTRAA